jgi:hypothetical protein
MLGNILNGGAVMKTISIFLALVNSLFAGLLIALSLSGSEIHQAAVWWSLTKILAALAIIMIGVLTWLGIMRSSQGSLIPLGSLFLVALGAGTVVWTLHLALVTGDMEYYMVVYGASLMMQGMASLLGFSGGSRDVTAS